MGKDISIREKRKDANGSENEPPVFPHWVIDIIRYSSWGLSRLLWRISYKGLENVPPENKGGLIIAANHQAYFDPAWVSLPVKRPTRYLAWNEAFSWPLVGRLLSLLGAWPLRLERGSPQAMRRSMKWLKTGGALVIFPEGERCFSDGKMRRFKAGAIHMALEAGTPILPVTIKGAHKVWPRDYKFPHLGKIEITYHPVQVYSVPEDENLKAYTRQETERLEKMIASVL